MGAWGIKALERDEGLDVLDILKNEYVPEHPVMDLGEMIELMKEEVMLGSDFSQIDFLFDNTAMALAELYFQWKDNGKLDYDHEEAIWAVSYTHLPGWRSCGCVRERSCSCFRTRGRTPVPSMPPKMAAA